MKSIGQTKGVKSQMFEFTVEELEAMVAPKAGINGGDQVHNGVGLFVG